MNARTLALLFVSLLALAACERKENSEPMPSPVTAPAQPAPAPVDAAASFVNKVWSVAESRQVAAGSLRVFLSDGTLVMASANEKPALGSWRYESGRLTIVEEGQDYPTDILALRDDTFRIRMHSPGEPVEITFEPAERVAPALLSTAEPATTERSGAIARADAIPEEAGAAGPASALWGTTWRLEALPGARVTGKATLEFPSEGRASGNGACNRFNGVVTIEGNAIRFGGLAATRMACAGNAMQQETAYFAALQDAERYEMDGESLRIFVTGRDEPLRFTATGESAAAAPKQMIERVAGTATSALAGIWTVVGHHIPGTSAMSDEAARSRYGDTVRLTSRSAASPGSHCREPGYSTRQVPAGSYLATQYRLQAGSLRPLAARNQLRVLEVTCGGAPWSALGATLIEIDRDRAIAPWDGVFFELERDRDFRGVGQEPGWQLEIRNGAEMRFTYDYGKGTAVTPAPRTQLDTRTGTRTFQGTSEGNDLRVEIVPVACNDSMSGRPFPATVTVTLNNRSFRGCGEELATPFQ